MYLSCYRVLSAGQDERARSLLHTAYHMLQERAGKLEDLALRRSFLNKVAAHREIVEAWKKEEEQADNQAFCRAGT